MLPPVIKKVAMTASIKLKESNAPPAISPPTYTLIIPKGVVSGLIDRIYPFVFARILLVIGFPITSNIL
jgi:hypothetical protein